ncbi:hypothetical protein Ancab_003338 [Ancistrocladus abbreviatus]
MQAQAAASASCFLQPFFPLKSAKTSSTLLSCPPKPTPLPRCSASADKAAPLAYESDSQTFDYSSAFSVFPAEACETVGGEACAADMYPEAKIQPEASGVQKGHALEEVERDYFDYSDPKSVLRGEACDDLGGEFCQDPYNRDVY